MTRFFLIFTLMMLCFSCSNDDVSNVDANNYYALIIGNSWIYENFKYNEDSQSYEETGIIDTVTITGKESIFGDDYYILKTMTTGNGEEIPFCNPNGEKVEYIRAYDGYLIDNYSNIKFANNKYEPILDRELFIGSYYFQLEDGTELITTDAGVFECQKMYRYFDSSTEEQYPGRHNFYYANGIGLVLETPTSAATQTPSIERRLVSYNMQ
jgi:hypothetical protein